VREGGGAIGSQRMWKAALKHKITAVAGWGNVKKIKAERKK
jgi:hypothetical protein